MESIIGFIPCRSGSERVKNKNLRIFAGFQHGLLELKLNQLSKVDAFDKIIISTNDDKVSEFVENFRKFDERFVLIQRPDSLGCSTTSMTEFIRYISKLENEGVVLWTHVTSPFIKSSHYDDIIRKYLQVREAGYDSLVTVTAIHKFIWSAEGPYNYNNSIEKWPRSQDINPLFEINHGAYMIPFELMRTVDDRIGLNPFMYNLNENIAMDIDWEEQFELFDDIATIKINRGESLI